MSRSPDRHATRPRRRRASLRERSGCAAPRAGRSVSVVRKPAANALSTARRRLPARHRGAARIASRRTCASGSCATRARARHRRRRRRRSAPRAPGAGRARRSNDFAAAPAWRKRAQQMRSRRRRAAAVFRCSRTSASKPLATPRRSVDASRRAPPARAARAPRASTWPARRVRQAADRLADGRADVASSSTFNRAIERRRRAASNARPTAALLPLFQPCAACPIALAASDANFGQRMAQRRDDVGDQRRPLEPAERADRDAHGLRVAAARAGPHASRDRAAVGARRSSACRIASARARRPPARRADARRRHKQRTKHEDARDTTRPLCVFRVIVRELIDCRRCRVAAEYSSICAVRSSGYEIVDVGDLARCVA